MKSSASRATINKADAPAAGQGVAMVDKRAVAVAQRQAQAAIDSSPRQVAQRQQAAAAAPPRNTTGLPDNLKAGVENLSGYSLDDVKVHYNSDKPAQLQAHAYAQGTDIHVAPGQEKHLPHEAWHVVQQKQGRVRPTVQMKGKLAVNDDAGLEKDADVMGKHSQSLKPMLSLGSTRQLKINPTYFASKVSQLAGGGPKKTETWSQWVHRYKVPLAIVAAVATAGIYLFFKSKSSTDTPQVADVISTMAKTSPEILVETTKNPDTETGLIAKLGKKLAVDLPRAIADAIGTSSSSIAYDTGLALIEGLDASAAMDKAISDPTYSG